MIAIIGSEFVEGALLRVDNPENKRFSRLHGEPVMVTPPRVWRPITWCSVCDDDLDLDDLVYYDEVNNLVHCPGCAGE